MLTDSPDPDLPPIGPVLLIRGIGDSPGRYRVDHVCEQLEIAGIPAVIREVLDPNSFLVEAPFSRTIILQRVLHSPEIAQLIQSARASGSVLIYDSDDLVFDPDSVSDVKFVMDKGKDFIERFREGCRSQRELMQECRFLLASTEPIADVARQQTGIRAFVHRNGMSRELANLSENARRLKTQRTDGGAILGYFSGSPTHNTDFATIIPALRVVLERFPLVRLKIVGPMVIDAGFESQFAGQIERVAGVDWRKLPELIASVDINLAPLELNNLFCDSKSELKYLEAALVAVPTIASPTNAFRFAISSGQNGILADTFVSWQEAMTDLIQNPSRRLQMGKLACDHVLRDYSPEVRSSQLVSTLTEIHRSEQAGLQKSDPRAGVREYVTQLIEYNRRWISARDITRRAAELWWERLCEFPGRLVRKFLPPR